MDYINNYIQEAITMLFISLPEAFKEKKQEMQHACYL